MDKLLYLSCFVLGIVMIITTFPEGNSAVFTTALFASLVVFLINKLVTENRLFLTRVFLLALVARLILGLIIHLLDLRSFFGGDANTYDFFANKISEVWLGNASEDTYSARDRARLQGVGWGMSYSIAIIYSVIGRNIYAAQCLFAVAGAAIAPLVYGCALRIYNNQRVAKLSAVFVALYPASVVWTGQLLKDGLIVFFLVLVVLMVLRLQEKFNYLDLTILIFSLFGIISLRFYIFYMIVLAIVGAFIIGQSTSPKMILRNCIILGVLGIALTYLGVIRYASSEFKVYGSLESVQRSRADLARAESGFGRDIDVSTTSGAISAIPIGLTYLMLAPFPWQVTNLRQSITLPDMIIWWASIPFLIMGLMFSIKQHLRKSIGIFIFIFMLSIVYALFQGNVGTAYRQRLQIQVFLFIFIGVGITLFLERRENRKAKLLAERLAFEKRLRENAVQRS